MMYSLFFNTSSLHSLSISHMAPFQSLKHANLPILQGSHFLCPPLLKLFLLRSWHSKTQFFSKNWVNVIISKLFLTTSFSSQFLPSPIFHCFLYLNLPLTKNMFDYLSHDNTKSCSCGPHLPRQMFRYRDRLPDLQEQTSCRATRSVLASNFYL